MRREWEPEELIACWTLVEGDAALIGNKSGPTRLGFCLLLKFFELEGRFPRHVGELPEPAVNYMAQQLGVNAADLASYDWSGRTIKYHRAQIREVYGFREVELSEGRLREALLARCRAEHIEPPGRLERILAAAGSAFDKRFCTQVVARLSDQTQSRLEELISEGGDATKAGGQRGALAELKADPGQLGLETLMNEIAMLRRVRAIGLPDDLFAGTSEKLLTSWRARAARCYPSDLRASASPVRLTLLASLCWVRTAEITDSLVDLLRKSGTGSAKGDSRRSIPVNPDSDFTIRVYKGLRTPRQRRSMKLVALVTTASILGLLVRHGRTKASKRHVPAAVQVSVLLDWARVGRFAPKLGISRNFGFLQHRVLGAAMNLRTISVRGTVRLPGALDVDIADDDWPVVATAAEAFLRDVAIVLRSEAVERGWEIDGVLDLRYATLGEATAGRPAVAVARQRHIGSSSTEPPVGPVAAVHQLGELPPTRQLTNPEQLVPTLDLTDLPSTTHAPSLVLVSSDGNYPALQLGPSDTKLVVGRGGGVDLIVPHPTVSARHSRLLRDPRGSWEIADLESKNGTWVNSSRAQGPIALARGDVVVFGTVRYEVAEL